MPGAAVGRSLQLRGGRLQRQQAGVPQASHHRHLVPRLPQLLLAAAEDLGRGGRGNRVGWG